MNKNLLTHWQLAGCSRHKLAQKAAELEVPVLKAIELRTRKIKEELRMWSATIDANEDAWHIAYPEMLHLLKELDQLATRPDIAGGVDDRMIDAARGFLISDLIEFNRFGKGICPFHNDTKPSLHYYPQNNSCYCHVCHKYADSIDVYMALNGVKFISAVKGLTR